MATYMKYKPKYKAPKTTKCIMYHQELPSLIMSSKSCKANKSYLICSSYVSFGLPMLLFPLHWEGFHTPYRRCHLSPLNIACRMTSWIDLDNSSKTTTKRNELNTCLSTSVHISLINLIYFQEIPPFRTNPNHPTGHDVVSFFKVDEHHCKSCFFDLYISFTLLRMCIASIVDYPGINSKRSV